MPKKEKAKGKAKEKDKKGGNNRLRFTPLKESIDWDLGKSLEREKPIVDASPAHVSVRNEIKRYLRQEKPYCDMDTEVFDIGVCFNPYLKVNDTDITAKLSIYDDNKVKLEAMLSTNCDERYAAYIAYRIFTTNNKSYYGRFRKAGTGIVFTAEYYAGRVLDRELLKQFLSEARNAVAAEAPAIISAANGKLTVEESEEFLRIVKSFILAVKEDDTIG